MRDIALVLMLGACGSSTVSSNGPSDASVMVDVPDVPPEAKRTREGLCSIWTFNEPAGSASAFDSSNNPSVELYVQNVPANNIYPAEFMAGDLVATQPARVISEEGSRINTCADSGAVTFEAWVLPTAATQGTQAEPAFIAGMSMSVTDRNIAFLQAGNKFMGVVKTSAAVDGTPRIVSTTDVITSSPTHLVLVADATRRTLYVNNAAATAGTPAAPTGWNLTAPMLLFDEYPHARQWTGRFSLVAVYKRALTPEEIQIHWGLRPNAD